MRLSDAVVRRAQIGHHTVSHEADTGGDIAKQTREVLAKIDDLLARAGTDKSRLLSVQIWLKSDAGTDALPGLRHGQSCRSGLSHRNYRDCDVLTIGRFNLAPPFHLSYAAIE